MVTACSGASYAICQACVSGSTYSNTTNAATCTSCITCTSGSYAATACTATSNTVCQPCPAGSSCPSSDSCSVISSVVWTRDPSSDSCSVISCPINSYCLGGAASQWRARYAQQANSRRPAAGPLKTLSAASVRQGMRAPNLQVRSHVATRQSRQYSTPH